MQKPFLKSRLFKLPENRKFGFIPRYYDEDKERIQNKRIELAKKLGLDTGDKNVKRELRIRGKFNSKSNNSGFNNLLFWPNIRLIVIFLILLLAFYYIYINLDDVLNSISVSNH